MRSHEKRVNVCPRTQGKYLVSVVLTAVFAIASLFGTLLFSADAVADAAESQAVAQVGNATYASVQEAIGHTSMKNATVTLLTDVAESVTITPLKGMRNVTFDLNGHVLQADGSAVITVPANMQLTITGPGCGRNTACGRLPWRTTREERHIHLGRNADAVRRNG